MLPLSALDGAGLADVGGKALNLGAMHRAGFPVPAGFCLTTAAFAELTAGIEAFPALVDQLDARSAADAEGIRSAAAAVRAAIEEAALPPALLDELREAAAGLRPGRPLAVRSSATLEDLPDASFAGQQDTYLGVVGEEALVDAVRRCFASLFTERAAVYRRQHGFGSRGAALAVVVQEMVPAEVSGILFTADPVSGHRGVCSIDASYGLGEALVSGRVNADLYRVDKSTGAVLERRAGDKGLAIHLLEGGGTEERAPAEAERARLCLDDAQLAALVNLARRVEERQGAPQDIEWAFAEGELFLLQTRAITSLFPVPRPVDEGLHIYLSFGHVQVMTDPILPMGIDALRFVLPVGRPDPDARSGIVREAAGRIFLDVTPALRTRVGEKLVGGVLKRIDPSMAEHLDTARARPGFEDDDQRPRARLGRAFWAVGRPVARGVLRNLLRRRPEAARRDFEERVAPGIDRWRRRLDEAPSARARVELVPALLVDVFRLLLGVFPPSLIVGMLSLRLLGRLTRGRAPEGDVDALYRGLEGNVTTDMDLELGDAADLAREVPALGEALGSLGDDVDAHQALARMRDIPGSEPFFTSWDAFVARYGHRGPSEIDLTRPRWRDDPSSLLRAVAGMLLAPAAGAHRAQHAKARAESEAAAARLVEAAGHGLLAPLRRRLARRLVRVARAYLALREHGKFYATQLFALARDALVEAGDEASRSGLLARPEDIFWLDLDEASGTLTESADQRALVEERQARYRRYASLRPPRAILSTGEIPAPAVGELPPGALLSVAASSGSVEGVARVVLDPTWEVLRHGEILVAPFTDPGWTPLFVHASALVMEVGGLMTHGSVVAREYGIPAVVAVDDATTRIRTGQRLRVDGTRGLVTLLDDDAEPAAELDAEAG